MSIGSLRSLMPDSVSIEPFVSETAGRVVTYGAPVTYPRAQVLPFTVRYITPDRKEIVSDLQVRIPGQVAIDPRSRITIIKPTGFFPSQPPIRAVRPYRALGMDCTEILC